MPSLKLLHSKFIEQTLSISNCITAYYPSVKYQCAELQERARSFILANFIVVTESEDFLNLSAKQVEEWIASDEIVVKGEEDVFVAILRWVAKNARRKQSFFELFRHVRCVYVSRNYLVMVILQHQLVRGKKQCLDLVLDAMKEVSDGTEACFLNHPTRNCLRTHEDGIFACGGDKKVLFYLLENKLYKMVDLHLKRNAYSFATSACQGKLYVIEGNTNQVECYNPLQNTLAFVKPLEHAIKFPAAVTFQGSLYVIGGVDSNNKRLHTVLKYNPDVNHWQEVPPLCSRRSNVCAVADGNNMYAIGGLDARNVCLSVVEKFDPEVNSWYAIAPMQAARKNPCGVSLHCNIFVFGGVHVCDGSPSEMYNKVTDVWTNIASAVAPRYPTSVICFKRQIFVLGRFGPNQSESQEMTLQFYDVDKDEWKPCSNVSLGSKFFKLSAVRVPRQVMHSCTFREFSKS